MNLKAASKILYFQKYLGILLILVGIPMLLVEKTPRSGSPLMFGLFILFISIEKVEDERIVKIKTSSLYIAFILAYVIKIVSSYLFDHGLLAAQLTEIDYFIILVFSISLIIYNVRMYFSS